jgi:RNA polymerase sigma-70 factor (ECF subfamily)
MISDWEYLTKAKRGDESAANYLFNKYYKSLIRMTALITGSLDSAKDIIQDTFLKLSKKRIKHHEGSFKTYLSTVAYRLALKERYRINRNFSLFTVIGDRKYESPLESQIEDETQKDIFEVIQSLKEIYKEILVLRFYGNHSYEEISEITKIPLGTVKSRIYYAVKECRTIMKKKGIL